MRHSLYGNTKSHFLHELTSAVLLLSFAVGFAVSAQESSPARQLPDAPAPKQNPQDSQQEPGNSRLQTTMDILGRKSVFFPDLAFDRGSMSNKQKLQLFLFQSVAPSRFISSAMGARIGQPRISLGAYGQEWGGYGKRFSSSMASGRPNQLIGTFLLASLLH